MFLLTSQSEGTETPLLMRLAPSMMLYPDRAGATHVFKHGFAEKGILQWAVDTFVKPDKAFLDIGAHVGTYTWTVAPRAAHVYAFECSPRTFCYLAANVALKGVEYKVSLFPYALGDKEGEGTYYIRSAEGGDNGIKRLSEADAGCAVARVPVRTLDSFGLENIGFVKLDVEGHEKEVLLGARETLRRSGWPKILFESWGAHANRAVPVAELRAGLFDVLREFGYRWVPVAGIADMFIAEHDPV